MRYGYIYFTTNLINGKCYVGKHKAGLFEPDKYIGSGTCFSNAVKKYGFENFKCELLEWCETKEQLNEREKYWVSYYNAQQDPNFYNIAPGGEGDSCFNYLQEERLIEVRDKISKANIGRKFNKEVCEKISKAKKNNIFWKQRKIICIETQHIYISITAAQEEFGEKNKTKINDCIKGKQKRAYGYHWAYLNDLKKQEELKEFIGKEKYKYGERGKPIICIENSRIFSSVVEAKNWLLEQKLPGDIYGAIYNYEKGATAGGYHWKYYKENENNNLINKKIKGYPIKCIELDKEFFNEKSAAIELNLNYSSINSCLKGKQKTAGGYHWEYLNKEK